MLVPVNPRVFASVFRNVSHFLYIAETICSCCIFLIIPTTQSAKQLASREFTIPYFQIIDTDFTDRSRHWCSACTVGTQCDGDIGKRNYFLLLTYPLAILFLYTTLFLLLQAGISHTQDYRNQRECLPVNNVRANTNLIKMCVKKSTSTTQHWIDGCYEHRYHAQSRSFSCLVKYVEARQ